MKKKNIFSEISTYPNRDSTKWVGKERSLLATILLWGLWACRVVSLLQISKLIFRKVAIAVKKATLDKHATRVNVPPMLCEIYFIAWFALLGCVYWFGIESPVLKGFIIYYLFESVVWVLYYTVFRRFFEENYSIYHELEYLTVLILIIPTQALGFASLYHDTFTNILSGLLGAGGDAAPIPVKILGALFGAIVISMIISAFPSEHVKKKYNTSKAFVIGSGDVVAERLHPALMDAERPLGEIKVFDLESHPERQPYAHYFENEKALKSQLLGEIDENAVVWIETPTSTHVSYLRALLETPARLIVLEKPIARKKDDLAFVKETITDREKRDRIFFLSYYVLEKALPLTMLFEYNERYRKYLDIEDEYFAKNWRMAMGSLVSAEVVIHEGKDSRPWVDADGGQLYETFLHNVLIASLMAGRPSGWENAKLTQSKETKTIELTATVMDAQIRLSQKKGVPESEKCRYARFEFSGGRIEADFETQSVKLCLDKLNKTVALEVKDHYRARYSILTDLVMRCYDGEISPHETDGLENQIEVIEWLSTL